MSTKIEAAAKEALAGLNKYAREYDYEYGLPVEYPENEAEMVAIISKHFPPAEPAVSVIRTDPLRGEVYGPAVSGEELERKLLAWMRAEAPVTIVQIASEARKIMEGRS